MQGILPFQAPEAKVVPQGFLPQAVTPPTRNKWSDMVPELLKTVVGGAIQMKLQLPCKKQGCWNLSKWAPIHLLLAPL